DRRGHFGIPKVIMGVGRPRYPLNDFRGQFGMTHIAFGLCIRDEVEGNKVVQGILHPFVQQVLDSCKWTAVGTTEWRLFKHLKRDFYNFIPAPLEGPSEL